MILLSIKTCLYLNFRVISNVRLEVTEEELYNILTKENPSFKVDNVEYTNVRFHT